MRKAHKNYTLSITREFGNRCNRKLYNLSFFGRYDDFFAVWRDDLCRNNLSGSIGYFCNFYPLSSSILQREPAHECPFTQTILHDDKEFRTISLGDDIHTDYLVAAINFNASDTCCCSPKRPHRI